MANPLYNQLAGGAGNQFLQQLKTFKKNFNGNPQQMVQNMISSGRVSQDQVNRCAQQATEIYRQLRGLF